MRNSSSQLTRVLSIVLVLGGLFFIFSAQISHFKSKENKEETIYIQDEGALSTQEEAIAEEQTVSTELVQDITDFEITQNEEDASNGNWSVATEENLFEQPLDFEHINLLVTNMNVNEREAILDNQDLFKQVIENEANNRSALMAAASNKLDQHPNVKFMMQRNSENMLLEFYLNLLVKRKLPEDFPSEEQISDYYDSNRTTQFTFPLRARIWQIFLSKEENFSEEEILELNKKAEDIILKIKSGNNDFSNLAVSFSQHEASRNRGGYMGVMEIDGLIPEIKNHILNSKVGEISNPIETDSGVHIIKRGYILEEETLEFEQVKDQIQNILIRQTGAQLKDAIFEEAREKYPQQISDNLTEEWWNRLRDEMNP